MAEDNVTGKNAVINWIWTGGTVNLNGNYRSTDIDEGGDFAVTTAGNDTKETQIATIGRTTINYNGLFPKAAAGTVIMGALAFGNEGTLQIYPEGTAAGNLLRTYPSISGGAKMSIPYNDVIAIRCDFKSQGAWS